MERVDQFCFASDNTSGACPEVWAAMQACNGGRVASYGVDAWTAKACDLIREVFEKEDAEVFFVFNGTAANSLALSSLCHSYHSVICHEAAHVETDECGAPEFFSNGMKLLQGGGAEGKLTPSEVERLVLKRSDIHYPKPHVVTLTQSTELGTVYALDEIAAVSEMARRHGLHVHMDGARFANALAALGATPADMSWKRGVDVLCLGGTKNGMCGSEAVIFFRPELAKEFDYRCKQAGQLASKMRFMSAQWLGLLDNGVWLRNAGRANAMARELSRRLEESGKASLVRSTESNAVFVEFLPFVERELKSKGWQFYSFIGGGSRLMCSWETRSEDIEALIADIEAIEA